jgi:hypothetical protein
VEKRSPRTSFAHRAWDLANSAGTPGAYYLRRREFHRLAYISAALFTYHQSIAGKGHWQIARWLLLPLAALQIARVTKTLLTKCDRAKSPMSAFGKVATPS